MRIDIHVYGEINSKLIYRIKDFEKIGFLFFLLNLSNKKLISCEEIINVYGMDISKIKEILYEAEELEIIGLSSNVIEQKIILEVEFLEKKRPQVNPSTLMDAFGISEAQLNELKNISKINEVIDHKIFCNNLIILLKKISLPTNLKNTAINSEEDLILYFNTIFVQDVFRVWKLEPKAKDFEFIFKLLVIDKMEKAVVNLLIDYSIKTNTYNNFNINFATKVANTWLKNNITNVKEGISFLKEVRAAIDSKKMKSKYVEPEFKEVVVDQNSLPTDLEIEDIIENVYN